MTKKSTWIVGGFVVVVLGALIYNLDAITGQWKFEQMCKAEGGPRFYEVAERGVGWEVDAHDTYSYQAPFRFDHVAFVRYTDKSGAQSDVSVDGYIGPGQRKYIFSSVDSSRQVRYRFSSKNEKFEDDGRFGRLVYEVIDLKSKKLVASYTQFSYQWTKPERVILSAPTGVGCWDLQVDRDKFFHGIYTVGERR